MSLVAFFGATGGCALNCLVKTLQAGISARALARTPAKLANLLLENGVSQATMDQHLVIIPGNARDEEAVVKTLKADSGSFVSLIISGLGAAPKFTPMPSIDDPTICTSAMTILIHAITHLAFPAPPLLVAISSTGLSPIRDVPRLLVPLYHGLLAIPHRDKKGMEDAVVAAFDAGVVASFVIVRPTLLTSGAEKSKIRVGREDSPEMGYSVSRKSVGAWIFRELVQPGRGGFAKWGEAKVSLTA
ncbi:hypothetical protein RQP46_005522 [Phenoliferia psychrophenolica]